jgi:hypothetical protein
LAVRLLSHELKALLVRIQYNSPAGTGIEKLNRHTAMKNHQGALLLLYRLSSTKKLRISFPQIFEKGEVPLILGA